ncbi:MAG: hypothetical protein CVU80_02085 [Elusimicrobia bacterium HGW-Elusimicrobia-4]|nr:MAG: hypothetical protein CVU80_02085 [Elusimicrobia bacterium HGW-Elusimicrobia-4]
MRNEKLKIDISEFEKPEKDEVVIPEKKIRVYPSEIGSWEYCNLKWLFERQLQKEKGKRKIKDVNL